MKRGIRVSQFKWGEVVEPKPDAEWITLSSGPMKVTHAVFILRRPAHWWQRAVNFILRRPGFVVFKVEE